MSYWQKFTYFTYQYHHNPTPKVLLEKKKKRKEKKENSSLPSQITPSILYCVQKKEYPIVVSPFCFPVASEK